MKSTLTLIIILVAAVALPAQEWKKQAKKADKLVQEGQYESAAALYESAWQSKPAKTDLMYKAGECYYQLKDYRRAADAYQKIKEATGEAGLAGLKYARSLKQTGQYELAKEELVYYIKRYKGADKKVVSKIVQTEIKGCELALSLAEAEAPPILVEHLSENINTLEDEFAPLPFTDDILYFSSTTGNTVNMYRSQRQSGEWTQAVIPDLPKVSGGVICGGCFSPDQSRFYFTVCSASRQGQAYDAPGNIYVTKMEDGEWSTPQRLHEYIRGDGKTATQPYVIHKGNEEILFFSSDREGGFGGMDIWYSKRQIKADDIDFTFPKNAGPMVNTFGDEISPFYNTLNEELYFSSNGHPALGGFDIFKAIDKGGRFGSAENVGTPLNSSNDDYYYIEEANGNGGFMVSNRLFGLEKITSNHHDIFFFSTPREQILISGKVWNKTNEEPMKSVVASLYELKSNNRQRLLHAKTFLNGNYEFVLLPNKEYKIVIEENGFGSAQHSFSTFDHDDAKAYTRDFELEEGSYVTDEIVATTNPLPTPSTSKSSNHSGTDTSTSSTTRNAEKSNVTTSSNNTETYIASSNNNTATTNSVRTYPRRKITTEAPVHSGTYYKVQLTVVIHYNPNQSQFREVKKMGRLDTEYITEKNWTRVLVADFFTLDEAHAAMISAQQQGFFDAFLVKYRNGRRITP